MCTIFRNATLRVCVGVSTALICLRIRVSREVFVNTVMNTLVLLKARICFPYLTDCEFCSDASSISLDSVYPLILLIR